MGVLKKRRARPVSWSALLEDPDMMFPTALASAIDEYQATRGDADPDKYSSVREVMDPLFCRGGILLAVQKKGGDPLRNLLDPVADALDVCMDVTVVRTSRLYVQMRRNPYNRLYEANFEDIVLGTTALVILLDGFSTAKVEEDVQSIISQRFQQHATIVFGPDIDEMKNLVKRALGPFVDSRLIFTRKKGSGLYSPALISAPAGTERRGNCELRNMSKKSD